MQRPQEKMAQHASMKDKIVGQHGFTVAEILIAIFIFAVIVTTVFGSYRATSEQVAIVSKNRQLVEMGRICLDRITNDLKALRIAMPPEFTPPEINSDPDPYRLFGTNETIGSQTFAELQFTSFSHLPIQPSRSHGIARIVYYIQPNKDDLYQLHRSDQLYPYDTFEADPMDPTLCRSVRSFDFTYYNDEGRSFDTWDSDSRDNTFSTPTAIGVRLEIGDEQDFQVFSTRIHLNVHRPPSESN